MQWISSQLLTHSHSLSHPLWSYHHSNHASSHTPTSCRYTEQAGINRKYAAGNNTATLKSGYCRWKLQQAEICCNLQQNIERFVITRKEQEETTASSDCRRSVLHRRLSTGLRGLGWLHEHNIDAAKQVWFSVRELKNIVRRTKVMFVHAKNTILWADETPVPWKYSLPASMSSLWMCYCLCL